MSKKMWIILIAAICVVVCAAVVLCVCLLKKGKEPDPEVPQGGDPVVDETMPEIGAEAKLSYTLNPDGASYTVSGVESKLVYTVTVPDTYENLPVTAIADALFEDASSVSTLTVGKNVASIGDKAFYNCDKLTSVVLPDSLRTLGMQAFSCCDSLTTVELGNGVTSIGYAAFSGCTALGKITIPASVTFVAEDAFAGCSMLDAVHITDLAAWCAIDFQYASANPLSVAGNLYVNDALVTALTLPDSVSAIGKYAFYNANAITSVTIPADLRSIGAEAFASCDALTDATFAESAEWWGYETASADTGSAISLPSAFAAAECLKDTYAAYYWKRG